MKVDCKQCKATYNFDASKLSEKGFQYKCNKCGNMVTFKRSVKVASEAGMPEDTGYEEDSQSFIETLPTVFVYPLHGDGLWILGAGTFMFGIVGFFRHYNIIPFIGMILGFIISGYLAAYLMKIISHSADGEKEVPDFPDFVDFQDSIIAPAFKVMGATVLPIIPTLAYYFLARPELGFRDPIVIILFLIGLFVIPMCLLTISLTDSISSINPLFIIPSILKTFGSYIVAFGMLVVIVFLELTAKNLIASIPFLRYFIESFLTLYFIMLEARVIGLVYYSNRERLNWY